MRYDFFNSNVPTNYDPRLYLQGFETFESAATAKARLASALADGNAAQRTLSGRLMACHRDRRCRSAACHVCARRFRVWWTSTLARQIDISSQSWFSVSIVPANLAYQRGELRSFDPKRFKDRLRKQLDRSSLTRSVAAGGIDFALQHYPDRNPKWRPHAYLLIQSGGSGRIKGAFDGHYPIDEDTPRPIRITQIKKSRNDALKVASYSYKSLFANRTHVEGRRQSRDTEKPPLTLEQEAELAPFLDRYGFGGRLFRRGRCRALPELTYR